MIKFTAYASSASENSWSIKLSKYLNLINIEFEDIFSSFYFNLLFNDDIFHMYEV